MDRDTFEQDRGVVPDQGLCGGERPLHVGLMVPGDSTALGVLERAVEASDCRLFFEADPARARMIVEGFASDLGRLRSHIVSEPALRFVREQVEQVLGVAAAPEGLPQLHERDYKITEVATEMEVPKGTTVRVSRDFTFDAAHNLPRYNGKCEKLHGHTFKVRVTVDAPLDTWSGMSFDFHDLKSVVKSRILDVLDHAYVNEFIPNPSAEFISIWIWNQLVDLPLHEVNVWETPNCFVTYCGPPRQ